MDTKSKEILDKNKEALLGAMNLGDEYLMWEIMKNRQALLFKLGYPVIENIDTKYYIPLLDEFKDGFDYELSATKNGNFVPMIYCDAEFELLSTFYVNGRYPIGEIRRKLSNLSARPERFEIKKSLNGNCHVPLLTRETLESLHKEFLANYKVDNSENFKNFLLTVSIDITKVSHDIIDYVNEQISLNNIGNHDFTWMEYICKYWFEYSIKNQNKNLIIQ